MWNHYIGIQIRRCNRNLLVPNLLMIVVVLALAFLARRYLYNFFLGPFPMDHETLLEVQFPDELSRYYVTLKITRPRGGGGSRRKVERDQEEEAGEKVGVVLIWDEVNEKYRLLLVKGSRSPTGKTVSGCLVRVPDHLLRDFVKPFETRDRKFRDVFLRTVCLDTRWFRLPGYVGLALGMPLVLFAGWNVLRGVARVLHPEKHPLVSQLARFGPPDEVAAAIQKEVSREAPHASSGSPIETRSWLLRPTFFGLEIIPLSR
jgi:hypothetical protein